jgi:hypothetical protein
VRKLDGSREDCGGKKQGDHDGQVGGSAIDHLMLLAFCPQRSPTEALVSELLCPNATALENPLLAHITHLHFIHGHTENLSELKPIAGTGYLCLFSSYLSVIAYPGICCGDRIKG